MKPYVPLSTDFFSDDKVIELVEQEPMAVLTFIGCLTVAKRSERDGRVTLAQVRRELPGLDHEPLLKTLVESRLIEQEDDRTFIVKAWFGWNKPAAELDQMRARNAEAGRNGGRASGATRRANSGSSQAATKHIASDERSGPLPENEAPVEAKRNITPPQDEDENHPTPTVPSGDEFAAARAELGRAEGFVTQKAGEGVDDEQALLVQQLVDICSGNNQKTLVITSVIIVKWASLMPSAEIAAVIKACAPKNPTLPSYVIPALERRATQLGLTLGPCPLPETKTAKRGTSHDSPRRPLAHTR